MGMRKSTIALSLLILSNLSMPVYSQTEEQILRMRAEFAARLAWQKQQKSLENAKTTIQNVPPPIPKATVDAQIVGLPSTVDQDCCAEKSATADTPSPDDPETPSYMGVLGVPLIEMDKLKYDVPSWVNNPHGRKKK